MWQSLHDAWWRLATQRRPTSFADTLSCAVLRTGSYLYRGALKARNGVYDRGWMRQIKLPCRVVSVGNLTVGGTGKTACVELIARKLKVRAQRVAILSRGYGGRRCDYWLLQDGGDLLVNGDSDAAKENLADEPQLLAEHLPGVPVFVGSQRSKTGRLAAEKFHSNVVILDDGFQHRRLFRDYDVVLVSARTPLAGWGLLPRGPMREPFESLKRAHAIVVTKADESLDVIGALSERLRLFNPDAALVTARHVPSQVIDALSGQIHSAQILQDRRIGLCSSIGDPAGFESSARQLHADVAWHRAFPDHHRFTSGDWDELCGRLRKDSSDALLTTEKDWMRLRPFLKQGGCPCPLWILKIRMEILEGEGVLDVGFSRVCSG